MSSAAWQCAANSSSAAAGSKLIDRSASGIRCSAVKDWTNCRLAVPRAKAPQAAATAPSQTPPRAREPPAAAVGQAEHDQGARGGLLGAHPPAADADLAVHPPQTHAPAHRLTLAVKQGRHHRGGALRSTRFSPAADSPRRQEIADISDRLCRCTSELFCGSRGVRA